MLEEGTLVMQPPQQKTKSNISFYLFPGIYLYGNISRIKDVGAGAGAGARADVIADVVTDGDADPLRDVDGLIPVFAR